MELITKIEALCRELQLTTFSEMHHELSNRAAKENWKYSEYLYEMLKFEADNRAKRSRITLTKMAGFPTIKTLEQFDFICTSYIIFLFRDLGLTPPLTAWEFSYRCTELP